MVEWHVTPDYIVNNWTDELLNLMTEKLVERKEMKPQASESPHVSAETLAAQAPHMFKMEKK